MLIKGHIPYVPLTIGDQVNFAGFSLGKVG